MTKTRKEAEAAKKLEIAVLKAHEDILEGAKTARKKIDDAADAAVAALEVSSRVPDKRNLDGSFQWDRGDRYRRGSDEKLQRLEDKINGERGQISTLEVGQARREEQIAGLINDCADLDGLIIELKTGHESVERDLKMQIDELRTEMNNTEKEFTSRAVTHRELILSVRDGFQKELSDYKTRNLWQVVLVLSTVVIGFIINRFINI